MVSRIGACGRRRKKGESVEVPAALCGGRRLGPVWLWGSLSLLGQGRCEAPGARHKLENVDSRNPCALRPAREETSLRPWCKPPGRPAPEPIGCGFESRLRPEGCVDSAQTQFS